MYLSYGYFWWRPGAKCGNSQRFQHVDIVAAQGNGGQKIYIVPQYKLVAVFTGGGYNADSTPPNTIMAKSYSSEIDANREPCQGILAP
jgi:hypothetical protein